MEVTYFLISVVLVSVSGALMPGPVLAVVLRQAPRNRLAGIEAALGHALLELPLVIAIAAGLQAALRSDAARIAIGAAGGVALLWMGISSLRAKAASLEEGACGPVPRSILQGLVASLNPYFFLWWATAGAAMIAKALSWSVAVLAIMFAAHIAVDFAWYGAVGFLAHGAHRIGGGRWQRAMLILCALAMIAFGLFFLRDAGRIAGVLP